jgi:D-sedoheptulose 7-phosphate isomerase
MAVSAIMSGLKEAQALLNRVVDWESNDSVVTRFANELTNTLYDGKKVLVCGNGGSMADAMHFAEEFTGRFRKDRRPYPVIAISDPAYLSCTANDYGYEFAFSRMVEALGNQDDMLVVLSTSGESPNILRAVEAAKDKGMTVVGFLGETGGSAKAKCDYSICVPHSDSERIQEIHMLMLHVAIDAVERSLGH